MYPPSANTNANTVTFQYLIHPPCSAKARALMLQCHQLAGRGAVYSANDTVAAVNLKQVKRSTGEALDQLRTSCSG